MLLPVTPCPNSRFQAAVRRRNRTITRSEGLETKRKFPAPILYGRWERKAKRDSRPLQAGACLLGDVEAAFQFRDGAAAAEDHGAEEKEGGDDDGGEGDERVALKTQDAEDYGD